MLIRKNDFERFAGEIWSLLAEQDKEMQGSQQLAARSLLKTEEVTTIELAGFIDSVIHASEFLTSIGNGTWDQVSGMSNAATSYFAFALLVVNSAGNRNEFSPFQIRPPDMRADNDTDDDSVRSTVFMKCEAQAHEMIRVVSEAGRVLRMMTLNIVEDHEKWKNWGINDKSMYLKIRGERWTKQLTEARSIALSITFGQSLFTCILDQSYGAACGAFVRRATLTDEGRKSNLRSTKYDEMWMTSSQCAKRATLLRMRSELIVIKDIMNKLSPDDHDGWDLTTWRKTLDALENSDVMKVTENEAQAGNCASLEIHCRNAFREMRKLIVKELLLPLSQQEASFQTLMLKAIQSSILGQVTLEGQRISSSLTDLANCVFDGKLDGQKEYTPMTSLACALSLTACCMIGTQNIHVHNTGRLKVTPWYSKIFQPSEETQVEAANRRKCKEALSFTDPVQYDMTKDSILMRSIIREYFKNNVRKGSQANQTETPWLGARSKMYREVLLSEDPNMCHDVFHQLVRNVDGRLHQIHQCALLLLMERAITRIGDPGVEYSMARLDMQIYGLNALTVAFRTLEPTGQVNRSMVLLDKQVEADPRWGSKMIGSFMPIVGLVFSPVANGAFVSVINELRMQVRQGKRDIDCDSGEKSIPSSRQLMADMKSYAIHILEELFGPHPNMQFVMNVMIGAWNAANKPDGWTNFLHLRSCRTQQSREEEPRSRTRAKRPLNAESSDDDLLDDETPSPANEDKSERKRARIVSLPTGSNKPTKERSEPANIQSTNIVGKELVQNLLLAV